MTNPRKGLHTWAVALLVLALGTLGFSQGRGGGNPGGGVSHKAHQTRPIQLGTSGGNAKDLANGFCCSGTLGSLVQIGTTSYILSNTHVFAGDSVPGGNNRVSTAGDGIDQPGLVDVSCQDIPADYVANLSQWATLNPGGVSVVDAAIAQVITGDVRTDGSILEIGTISSSTVAASPGQAVKKSGRTTGLSRSSVDSINATVSVQYSDECAGNTFITTYTGQILVKNRASKFLNSGDSGSLMVEDVTTNPRAVGLLFAGSNTIAVANPINDVLSFFGATMVGSTGALTPSTSSSSLDTQRDIARAIRTQQLNAHVLSKVPRAVGHAVGLEGSEVVIKVLVEELTAEALADAPKTLEGFRVVVEEVGKIVAF